MTHVTCRLTANNRDQLRNPTLGNRVRATLFKDAWNERWCLWSTLPAEAVVRIGRTLSVRLIPSCCLATRSRLSCGCCDSAPLNLLGQSQTSVRREHTLQIGLRPDDSLSLTLCIIIFVVSYCIVHGLHGSASPVLTSTGFVNGRGQFLTPTLATESTPLDRSPKKLLLVITSATPTAVPNLVQIRSNVHGGLLGKWVK